VHLLQHRRVRYSGHMIEHNDPEIERSPLSGSVTRSGISVRVEIYRLVGGDEGWSLEVINGEGDSTVWEGLFATDKDAYAEFCQTLELEGIRSFSERTPGRVN
jgi:hypothetical protein